MRHTPYTKKGIRRVPCFRCKEPSQFQWTICSDGNQYRGLCARCDVGLNNAVLIYLRDPNRNRKIKAYRISKGI